MEEQNLKDLDWLEKKLNMKRSWIYGKTRTNEIPHIKLGKYLRFDEQKILAWVREHSAE